MMGDENNLLQTQLENEPKKCTITACTDSTDQHSLQCLKCKRKVHYQCTLLPLYQLQQYLTFGSNYKKFTCKNCVIIQEDLREIISTKPNVKACQIETLNFELESQKNLVKSYTNEISFLKEKLKKLEKEEEDNPTKKRKRNQQEEDIILLNETLSSEIKQLRQESKTLKTLLDERETALDETLTKLNDSENEAVTKKLDQGELLEEMKNIMNHRIDQMENKIENLIEEKIEEKQRKGNISSFAETLKQNLTGETIENAIKVSRNNEKIQKIEQTKRENNLIIHGVYEFGQTDKEKEKEDQTFIKSFLEVIGVNVLPISVTRIGKIQDGRIRPIKLVMNSLENKDRIMSRLVNLKYAEERFKRLSVKDDYTVEERQLIKIWHQKAEERNTNENTTMWKVRGTPKNGLRIVKVIKNQVRNQLDQNTYSWGTETMETTVETN